MKPLDYLFELLILGTFSYNVYAFWKNYIKINKKTIQEDQLIRAYTALSSLRKRRQDHTCRLQKKAQNQIKTKTYVELLISDLKKYNRSSRT